MTAPSDPVRARLEEIHERRTNDSKQPDGSTAYLAETRMFRVYKAHSEILCQVAELLGTDDDEAIVGRVRELLAAARMPGAVVRDELGRLHPVRAIDGAGDGVSAQAVPPGRAAETRERSCVMTPATPEVKGGNPADPVRARLEELGEKIGDSRASMREVWAARDSLVAAVTAVLDLHQSEPMYDMCGHADDHEGLPAAHSWETNDGDWVCGPVTHYRCAECRDDDGSDVEFPCTTRRDVSAALGVTE